MKSLFVASQEMGFVEKIGVFNQSHPIPQGWEMSFVSTVDLIRFWL